MTKKPLPSPLTGPPGPKTVAGASGDGDAPRLVEAESPPFPPPPPFAWLLPRGASVAAAAAAAAMAAVCAASPPDLAANTNEKSSSAMGGIERRISHHRPNGFVELASAKKEGKPQSFRVEERLGNEIGRFGRKHVEKKEAFFQESGKRNDRGREATDRTKRHLNANYLLNCPWLYAFSCRHNFWSPVQKILGNSRTAVPPVLPPQIKNRRFRRDENVCIKGKWCLPPPPPACTVNTGVETKVGQG